jgi:hypothetical protein
VVQKISEVFEEIVRAGGTNPMHMSSVVIGTMVGDSADTPIKPACEGVEAVLAAMVMGAYASFESLAADLWIAAVNRHPDLATKWLEKNTDKQIPANVIAGYGFNLSGCMGTVLHDTKKVTFESLFDIKKQYMQAFRGATDAAFEPIDELVKAEKTRHLFAHRGGLFDQKFKDQMRNYPEYADAVVGERLRLIGPVTGLHVRACAAAAFALLKAVDDWSVVQA